MYKITVVMAIHRRPIITTETINRLKKQKYINGIVVVGDSNTERKIAEDTNIIYLETNNRPLGRKWQLGVSKAKHIKNNGVMICGSDGWISENWCESMVPQLKNFDLIGKNRFYLYNIDTKELLERSYFGERARYPVGSGRIISRRILDKMKWNLFPIKRDSGLDTYSTKRIVKFGGRVFISNNNKIFVFGLKGNYDTITNFKKIKTSIKLKEYPIPENNQEYLRKKMPDVYSSIKKIE